MTSEPVAQNPIGRVSQGKLKPSKKVLSATRSVDNDGRVAPFPRERFLKFCSILKIQSRDYGLVPFVLNGTQHYLLDKLCEALDQGITTIVVLKDRQSGVSTFFLALDMFWAFENKGILGVFATH